ncbi:hypothetical protein Bbelb_234960 [Branchiostoma belcheri]|nr:hypothetical protein Bbelb_234960 [Branchiostoma belcheri]
MKPVVDGKPVVYESASKVEVNLAQTGGQDRDEAPEMNAPLRPGVESGASAMEVEGSLALTEGQENGEAPEMNAPLRPGVESGASAMEVEGSLAQTEGQEKGDAPAMNAPMPPGEVEAGAETSEESDELDLYSVMRQARADRVLEFSRRNKAIDTTDRPWAEVVPDRDYPYRPKDFIPPGPLGLKRKKAKRTELSFFLEIFDRACVGYVVRCTNKYARERRTTHPAEKRSRWKPTNSTELKAFLGCMMVAGYVHLPNLAFYWGVDQDCGCRFIKRTFPFHRFRQILRYLHYSPEGYCPPGSQRLEDFKAMERLDRVLKVRQVMERVNENSRSARHVGEHLVVDEAMVAFRGRHKLRQYNPSKPTKYGYCVRVLAEADGYILADEVSGARKDPEDMSARQRAMHGVGDDQVSPLDLKPARIVHRLTLPFQGRYRTVFCDSYYTDAQLADHLFGKDTYLVGTVRRNGSSLPTLRHPIPPRSKRGRPPTQSFRDPFPKLNVPRGYSVRYHDGPLTAVKWQDTKTLILLSTGTSVGAPDVQVTRRSKGPGGGAIRQQVPCPAMVELYNRHYKGVDKADQLRSSYEFGRPSKKWHRQLFWYVLNKAVVNAYLNWSAYMSESSRKKKEKIPVHKTTQLSFRRALVRQLVGNFSARRKAPAGNPPVVPPVIQPVNVQHEHVRRGKPTRACRYCAKARRHMTGANRPRPHETIYECSTCKVSVCRASLRPMCWREHLDETRQQVS